MSTQGVSRILIVRRDNIGDLVCTTPAIATLRHFFPGAEIAALVNSYNADVLLGNPNLDRVFVYQKHKHAQGVLARLKALWQKFLLLRELRRWSPELVILAKSGYDRQGAILCRQIGAAVSIGFAEGNEKPQPTVTVPTPAFAHHQEVVCLAILLKALGIREHPGELEVFPDLGLAGSMAQRFAQPRRNRLALHLSAREPERRWGEANYLAFIRQILMDMPEIEIGLFWSPGAENDPAHPGDDALAAQILARIADSRLIPMPSATLPELIAGLSCCKLFVGADGGAMHLAVATGCRVVALFENRPDKMGHWYPWATTHTLLHGPRSDVSSIGPGVVARAARDLLDRIPDRPDERQTESGISG